MILMAANPMTSYFSIFPLPVEVSLRRSTEPGRTGHLPRDREVPDRVGLHARDLELVPAGATVPLNPPMLHT